MLIENLVRKQRFLYQGRKFKTNSVSFDRGCAWVETACGTLICDRIGTFVEEIQQ